MEIYVSSSQLCRYAQRKIADQLDKISMTYLSFTARTNQIQIRNSFILGLILSEILNCRISLLRNLYLNTCNG